MFGGTVIASFSWAMLFGVVIGTYSSIFIAAPVLIYLGLKSGAGVFEDKAQTDQTAPTKAGKQTRPAT
jgi:preprotein translocase subunit SecF